MTVDSENIIIDSRVTFIHNACRRIVCNLHSLSAMYLFGCHESVCAFQIFYTPGIEYNGPHTPSVKFGGYEHFTRHHLSRVARQTSIVSSHNKGLPSSSMRARWVGEG